MEKIRIWFYGNGIYIGPFSMDVDMSSVTADEGTPDYYSQSSIAISNKFVDYQYLYARFSFDYNSRSLVELDDYEFCGLTSNSFTWIKDSQGSPIGVIDFTTAPFYSAYNNESGTYETFIPDFNFDYQAMVVNSQHTNYLSLYK